MHSIVVQKTVEIPQLQFLDLVVVPVRATTSFGTDSAETVELPQVQLLWCCGRHCDHTARFSPTECWTFQLCPQCSYMVYDSCPWSRQCCSSFTDKVVDIPGSEQWKELNDDFEAVLAHFSDSPERG